MSFRTIFTCDVCNEEYVNRDLAGNPTLIGGMSGFTKRVIEEKKEKKEVVMKYDFDLCEKCSKKMLEHYFKIGGK